MSFNRQSGRAGRQRGRIVLTAVILGLGVCGCSNFFEKRSTELETREILDELSRIRENPHVKNPLPEMYRGPAKRLKLNGAVKLFYFTKHHPPKELVKLLKTQLGVSADSIDATNQLVIQCKTDAEADQAVEFLEKVDVPPIQVNIDCLILERYADVTMDWETTILIENFLGEEVTLGEGKKLEPAFPGAAMREIKRRGFGLDFGYWHDKGVSGHQLRAVVDLLVSRGYLKILMNPTLETVNGQRARISLRDNVPLQMLVSKGTGVEPYNLTEYQWVEDLLEVTPHVFADGSIGLQTSIQMGSKSKPEGVVQSSIITERKVEMAENRIAPGDSLIVAGIRKSEKRSVIRGIPFFKDIPIIGVLFSSKDFEERGTETIFILTPSISSGGVEYSQMAEDLRKKHATPRPDVGIEEFITDPFGAGAYTEHVEEKAAQAEFERLRAEIEKAETRQELGQVKEKLLETTEKVLAEKARTAKAGREVKRMQQKAEKLKVEVEQALAAAKQKQVEADKARAEARKAQEQAEKAKLQQEQKQAPEQKNNKEETKQKPTEQEPNEAEPKQPEQKAPQAEAKPSEDEVGRQAK